MIRSLIRIVSGGQTGVDRAALDAALAAGYDIGGWCPAGRLAEDGCIPDSYPLTETAEDDPAVRTERNVRDSDGTLLLSWGEPTGGTALTLQKACCLKRPCKTINLYEAGDSLDDLLRQTRSWIDSNQIRILNIAGPRASRSEAVYPAAFWFMTQLLHSRQKGCASSDRLRKLRQVDIYPVTCEKLSNGKTDLEVFEALIAGGARMIQLRDKTSSRSHLLQKARICRDMTRKAGVLLIINDHVDIAMAVHADGVHLGQDDFPLNEARKLLPNMIIGVSTHNLAEAIAAQEAGADYVNIGPVFSTQTKDGVGEGIGPNAIRDIAPNLHIPFTTMGGIKLSNVQQVKDAGARIVAVVTALTQADDIAAETRKWRNILSS